MWPKGKRSGLIASVSVSVQFQCHFSRELITEVCHTLTLLASYYYSLTAWYIKYSTKETSLVDPFASRSFKWSGCSVLNMNFLPQNPDIYFFVKTLESFI